MEGNSLFSVCIPTCNRVNSLREALPDLISKVSSYNIKIFIQDNNSKDETESYIQELQKVYPFIFYRKVNIPDYQGLEGSLSAERNIKEALEFGNTKYKLLLGDHYILFNKNSIDVILKALENEDNDAFVLHHNRRLMPIDSDMTFSDKDVFLKTFGWYISMVSTVIYNERIVSHLPFEKYYNSNFAHTFALLDYISENEFRIKYLSSTLTWTTKSPIKGLSSWHGNALDVFTKSWYKGVMSLPVDFDEKAKKECIKNHNKYNPTFYSLDSLVLYYYAGGITISKIIKNFKYFKFITSTNTIILSILIALVPKKLIPILFPRAYSYIKRVLGNMDKYRNS